MNSAEAQPGQHVGTGRQQLGLDGHRRRAGGVDIALVELPEAPLLRPIGAPDRLHLIPPEVLRKGGAMVRHDPRQRHGQVVTQGQVGLAGLAIVAPLQDFEDQPVALFPVLASERLDVLDGRRLERLEAIALVDVADHADHVLAAPDVGRQEVAHAARWGGGGHQGVASAM